MIRALAAGGAWALMLMLACGLVIAPTMHGIMVACGREAFEVADLVEGGYEIAHWGSGHDTSVQVVTNPNITKLSPEVLRGRLAEWIGKLHDGRVTVLDDYAEGER